MANYANKTEHVGAKKGRGAYPGRKADAKRESDKARRRNSKLLVDDALEKSKANAQSFREATMRKRFKDKERSCGLCKPHERGWDNRWKPKAERQIAAAEREIHERINLQKSFVRTRRENNSA